MTSKYPANDEKFDFVRMLNLPLGQYLIVQSGALGIREIREIGDIDMIVTDELWENLSKNYDQLTEDGITKIKIGGVIEAMRQGSFAGAIENAPSIAEQIDSAEVIQGLPFQNLKHLLFFKQHANRPKDQADIQAIKTLLGQW